MYGRARRIKLFLIIGLIIIFIIGIVFVVSSLNGNEKKVYKSDNVNFKYLKNYFENKGYTCEALQKSGSKCSFNKNDKFYQFTRYDDGFEYIFRTNSYIFIVKNIISNKNYVVFRTGNDALFGYRSKEYTCKIKDNIIGELDSCIDSEGIALDSNVYLGVISQNIDEIRNILLASGYDVNKLINDYVWEQ